MMLIKRNFKTWLKSHKPTDIVGYSVQADNCPIANFLQEFYRITIEATSSRIFIQNPDHPDHRDILGNTPEWAEHFIQRIDRNRRNKLITAQEALNLL